jgi:hypothetical protein
MKSLSLCTLALSLAAALTQLTADSLTELWKIAPDERSYVTTGNTERGIALNPANGNVLLLGRAGGPQIYVLNGEDGNDGSAELGIPKTLLQTDLNGESIMSGGTFPLNLVGAAADGAVYAANLQTASPPNFRVYRWANDGLETPVSLAFGGDLLEGITDPGTAQDIRFGDNFAVRGSGLNTQFIVSSRNGKYLVLFTTTDGENFTPTAFTTDALGRIGTGLTFGDGNTVWAKVNGQPLVQLEWNLTTKQARIIRTVAGTLIPLNVVGIAYDPTTKRLATVDYLAHSLAVYDLSDPSNPLRLGDPLPFATANANGNGTAAAGLLGDRAIGLDTNNGPLAAKVEKSVVADPPVIGTEPASATVYATANHTFAVAVQGTPPLSYQWFFQDAPITGQTSAQLTLNSVTAANGGGYSVVVTNTAGAVTSRVATLTVRIPATSTILTPLWTLPPGSRPYLGEDNSQRGLAANPVNGNVLLVSRTGSNQVVVLDGATGAEKHKLRMTLEDETAISGGTFAVNLVGVANDGAVYVANLTTDGSTSPFRLYRWATDSAEAIPTMITDIPELAIPERWGDTLSVRGSGNTTQVALASRNGSVFALLNLTENGALVSAKVLTPTDVAAGDLGLGLAFGSGNTLWATANGRPLNHISFDFDAGTAALVKAYPNAQVTTAVGPLGVSVADNFLAGIAFENPDNVQLFNLADLENLPLVDQELIPLDRANINGTGAASFGSNRLFVLNTNNGINAYTVNSAPVGPAALGIPSVDGTQVILPLSGTPGATYSVRRSSTLGGTFISVQSVTIPASGNTSVTLPATDATSFFQAEPATAGSRP